MPGPGPKPPLADLSAIRRNGTKVSQLSIGNGFTDDTDRPNDDGDHFGNGKWVAVNGRPGVQTSEQKGEREQNLQNPLNLEESEHPEWS